MAIAAIWCFYALNRLWQQHFNEVAAGALAEAARLGLTLRDPRFGAVQVFEGAIDGRALRVEWRGGGREMLRANRPAAHARQYGWTTTTLRFRTRRAIPTGKAERFEQACAHAMARGRPSSKRLAGI